MKKCTIRGFRYNLKEIKLKCAAVLLPLVLCPPAHNTERREGGCTDDPGGETVQEERLINTVEVLLREPAFVRLLQLSSLGLAFSTQ